VCDRRRGESRSRSRKRRNRRKRKKKSSLAAVSAGQRKVNSWSETELGEHANRLLF
jgi:hypothetical protein